MVPVTSNVRSIVRSELFAHDLAHELLRDWLLTVPGVGLERLVNQGLVSLSRSLRLCFEALQNRAVKVNGDARFPGGGNYGATLAFGEGIHLSHR